MKRTSFVLSFIFGLLLLSNSSVVFADGSKEFIPDPKPDDAYFEDQFSKRKAMYEEKGYVEVDPSTSPLGKELLKSGEITQQEISNGKITLYVPSETTKLLNECEDSIPTSYNNENTIQASCSYSHTGVLLRGPSLYYPTNPSSYEVAIRTWHEFKTYSKDFRQYIKPTWNQVQFWRTDSKYTVQNARFNYQFAGTHYCDDILHDVANFNKYFTVSWKTTNDSYYYTWGPTDYSFPSSHEPVYNNDLTMARWYGNWYWNGSKQFSQTVKDQF